MEAGKHVLVEKPISNDVVEARQMVAKAAEKKVYLGCNLNHFFTPPAEKAMQYIEEGHVGELIYCLHKFLRRTLCVDDTPLVTRARP